MIIGFFLIVIPPVIAKNLVMQTVHVCRLAAPVFFSPANNYQVQNDMEQDNHFENYLLHHVNSHSSLASQSTHTNDGNSMNNSLIVNTFTPDPILQPSPFINELSRQSSLSSINSFDNSHQAFTYHNYETFPDSTSIPMSMQPQNHPMEQQLLYQPMMNASQPIYSNQGAFSFPNPSNQPKLAVQTQGLGKTVGRPRSMSRSAPYSRRHMSESFSAT